VVFDHPGFLSIRAIGTERACVVRLCGFARCSRRQAGAAGCGEALAWPLEPFVQAVGNHELRPRSVMGAQEGQQGECVLVVQQGGHFLDWKYAPCWPNRFWPRSV
jgi:hypothetical protein